MRLTSVLGSAATIAVAIGGLLFSAPGANASSTPINTVGGGGSESSLLAVLAGVYGSTSSGINDATLSFGSGAVTLTRVDDAGFSGELDLHTGVGGGIRDDQVWKDGVSNFRVEAKIAGNSQNFGYDVDGAGGVAGVTLLTNAVATNTATGGPVSGSGAFQWFLKSSDGSTWYSDNGSANDHMVTWQVTFNSGARMGEKVWLVAWEDLNLGDWDYQDLVVEITVVPLPAAAWSGLAMLAGLGVFGLIRRRQQAQFV